MREVLARHNFTNLTMKDLELLTQYDACHTGKIRRTDRPKAPGNIKTTRIRTKTPEMNVSGRAPHVGHTVVADSSGKRATQTMRGKKYVNVMVNVKSKWVWATLLRTLKNTLSRCTSKVLKQLIPAGGQGVQKRSWKRVHQRAYS